MSMLSIPGSSRWHLIAPTYKRDAHVHWLVMLAIFAACGGLSIASTFYYHEAILRPALGASVAAMIVLRGRDAIFFLVSSIALGVASYAWFGTTWYQAIWFPILNAAEACLVAILARRFCGARFDLSRPNRMANYVTLAVLPATIFRGIAEVQTGAGIFGDSSDNIVTVLASQFVAMLLVTPIIVHYCLGTHKETDPKRPMQEIGALSVLALAFSLATFTIANLPLTFVALLPLVWVAFRLNIVHTLWIGAMVILVASVASIEGWGPIALVAETDVVVNGVRESSLLNRLFVLQAFCVGVVAVILPIGVGRAEETRLLKKLGREHLTSLNALNLVRSREKQLRIVALNDHETGLCNRPGMIQAVGEYLLSSGHPFVYTATISVNRYLAFRTAMGSAQAGELMRQAGIRIGQYFPNSPIARLAPDELAVAFPATDDRDARQKLDRLAQLFQTPLRVMTNDIDVDIVIGVAFGNNPNALIQQSEAAVIQSRKVGLTVAFFDADIERQAAQGLSILSDLHSGLTNGDVWLSFQPKLCLKTNKLVSAECLIRWNHPTHGAIGPEQFIPLAEETGFIDGVTDWVVQNAAMAQRRLASAGLPDHIAINISARSLVTSQFASRICGLIRAANANPKDFTLEVTETGIMQRSEESVKTLNQLKSAGFNISIDNYGAGQSSLNYLRRLPASELKIDNAFVINLAADSRDALLVRSTIDLAHGLGLKVVAEGVEDEKALSMLALFGCDVAQGFHIARPMSIDKLIQHYIYSNNRKMVS